MATERRAQFGQLIRSQRPKLSWKKWSIWFSWFLRIFYGTSFLVAENFRNWTRSKWVNISTQCQIRRQNCAKLYFLELHQFLCKFEQFFWCTSGSTRRHSIVTKFRQWIQTQLSNKLFFFIFENFSVLYTGMKILESPNSWESETVLRFLLIRFYLFHKI